MKSLYKKIAFTISALAVSSASLFSTTYYVSPSGNDNNDGTSISSAWKTIGKINSQQLAPGATILFEAGATFSGEILLDQNDGNDPANLVTISSYGTGRAIISSGATSGFYAYNTQGFTVSNLIFEGSGMSSNTTDGMLIFTDVSGNQKFSNVNIVNTDVRNYGKTGISVLSTSGNTGFKDLVMDKVHVYQVKQNGITTRGFTMQSHTGYAHINVTIKNSEVDHVPGYADASTHRGSGIILAQVDNGLIEKTVAHDNGAGNTHCGGPGGIWAWDCNNLTIQHCESYKNKSGSGCDGLGFDFDGGVTNSVMQYNYSHDNDGAGYLLGQYDYARPWADNVVRYNISENDGRTNSSGINLFKGPGTTMTGVQIYNNTVYSSPSSGNSGVAAFAIVDWNTGINNVKVYNNIFQTIGSTTLVIVPAGYSAAFAGNLYWSTGGTFKIKYQGTTYSSVAAWRTATGNETAAGAPTGVTADPLLFNPGTGLTVFPNPTVQLNAYSLAANSPAIGAGVNLMSLYSIDAGQYDFFNSSTAGMVAFDIGAARAASVTTGIASHSIEASPEISVYPNPIHSGDMLSVKGAEMPYSAELISATGSTVWKNSKVESPEILLPELTIATGMYILVVVDNNGKKKITKLLLE